MVGIAKALDEFYWTTITNKVKLPDIKELRMWSRLADSYLSQPIETDIKSVAHNIYNSARVKRRVLLFFSSCPYVD